MPDVINLTTDSDLSPVMKEYYKGCLIDNAKPKLVHRQFGAKKPIPANNGKIILFRKYSPLPKATTPLTEGVTPDGRAMKVTDVPTEVKQYGDYIKTSDVFDKTAIDNNLVQTTKLLGSQSGRTLDSLTRDVLAGGTNVMYADKVVGGVVTEVLSRSALTKDCKLTVDMVEKAVAHLKAMNAEPLEGGMYAAIIHPYVVGDLRRSPEWRNINEYGRPEDIYKGELGEIGGARFFDSTEAKIWKDGTCPAGLAVFSTLFIGENAYGVTEIEGLGLQFIHKPLGAGNDPLNQRSTNGWKASDACPRLSDEFMVRVESVCDASSKVQAN